MPANQPYDPLYNAKLYVPKRTEEERRARATPLENLRSLRFRTETPAAPSPVEAAVSSPVSARDAFAKPYPSENVILKSAAQVTAATKSMTEAVVLAPVQAQIAPAPHYIPTAREVLFAEFPELFPFPYQEANCEEEENNVFSESCRGVGPDGERPRHDKAPSQYLEPKPRPAEHRRRRALPLSSPCGRMAQFQQGNQTKIVNSNPTRLPALAFAYP